MFGIDDMVIAIIMSALISATAAGATAFSQKESQEKANDTNIELQKMANEAQLQQVQMANEFNAAEAEKQRAWQTQMSNTQIQRAMADYSAAGLNPILAVPGGATVASGASANANVANIGSARVAPASFDFTGISSALNSMTNFMLTSKMLEQKDVGLGIQQGRLNISKSFADSYGNQVGSRNAQNSAKASYYNKKVELMNKYLSNQDQKNNKDYWYDSYGRKHKIERL